MDENSCVLANSLSHLVKLISGTLLRLLFGFVVRDFFFKGNSIMFCSKIGWFVLKKKTFILVLIDLVWN